ncbi:MAG: ribosome silencing factor [Eikenella sp.]|nr:ribosome silencing factor [Eikenella sp.]
MNTQEKKYLQDMVDTALAALEDVKAKDIVIIDTSAKTSLFARMIVAGGDSTRQVRALANHVAAELKAKGFELLGSEGEEGGEWALVDAGDLVVHIMLPTARDFYAIEQLWGE